MTHVPTTLQQLQRTAPPVPAHLRKHTIIRPFDKQIEAHKVVNENFMTLYGGAIRGGKTYFMLLELFTLAQEFANSRWMVMRADMPRFTQTTLRSFEELLDSGIGQYMKRWHKGTNTVTWMNGSQFVFLAESYQTDKELLRLRGIEFNGAGLDEVNELQENTLDKIVERTGSWFHSQPNKYGEKVRPKIIMTCNPTSNWVKTRFYDPWENGVLGRPGPRLKRGIAYIPSRIYDNPHVPPEYLETLRLGMPEEKYQMYVNGDWNYSQKTGNEWVHAFDAGKHVGQCDFIRDYPVKLSFDFNQNPYQTMLGIQMVEIDGITWIRVFDEFAMTEPNNTPEAACDEFIRYYIDEYGYVTTTIYGDASGKAGVNGYRGIFQKMAPYMHNEGDQVWSKNQPLMDCRDLMNEIFSEKLYPIRVLIDRERCPLLTKDLDTLQKHNVEGFDPEKKNGIEQKGHMYSALVYCVCQVYRHLLRKNKLY